MADAEYDPFAAGPHPVDVRTIVATDQAGGRLFPIELWSPAQSGLRPLIVFSHYSGGHRRTATYLCTHLASHGYVVAAMDHSEVVAPELAPRAGEMAGARAARIDAIIGSRVPDVQLLLDHLLGGDARVELDAARIGLVGHSFGGWTVLAAPEVDSRVRSVVALAPGGSSSPKPGILPLKLTFAWGRDVPTLYLAAENDVPIPLAGVYELFDRTQSSKRMFILRRADHQQFIDDVEETHEAVPVAMRPVAELSSGEQAHTFVRGLTLAHFDATLRQMNTADRFLSSDVEADLAARGVEAFVHRDVMIN